MAAILGMRGIGDWSTPDERPKSYREMAFKLFPDSPAPFTYILSKLGSRAVSDYEYKMFEWRLPDMAFTINGALNSTDATLTFDAPGSTPTKGIKAGDLLRVELTGEIMLVLQNPTTPFLSCVVYRHWGSSAAGQSIADDSIVRWAGSAYEEGSRPPVGVSRSHAVKTNYCQIFKDTAEITGSAKQTTFRPQKPWAQLKGEALERHMIKIESSLLYGVAADATGPDGRRLSTTGGLNANITTNVTSFSSSGLSLTGWEDAVAAAFKYGSKTKLGFCGNGAMNIINRMFQRNTLVNHQLTNVAENRTFGLVFTEYRSPFGRLMLTTHPLMTESAQDTSSLFVIDTKFVEWVYLNGRDTDWQDIETDEDAQKGYYMTEGGLGIVLEEVHAKMTGITTYVG